MLTNQQWSPVYVGQGRYWEWNIRQTVCFVKIPYSDVINYLAFCIINAVKCCYTRVPLSIIYFPQAKDW